MRILEEYLKRAAEGRHVLIVMKGANPLSIRVNGGSLFIRDHHETSLKSVSVDTVVFVGDTPTKFWRFAVERTSGQCDPELHYVESDQW